MNLLKKRIKIVKWTFILFILFYIIIKKLIRFYNFIKKIHKFNKIKNYKAFRIIDLKLKCITFTINKLILIKLIQLSIKLKIKNTIKLMNNKSKANLNTSSPLDSLDMQH
jgi:hypothetical protein